MLSIRPEQMQAMRKALALRFEERMLSYLRENYASHLTESTGTWLRALIRQGIEEAERSGIQNEKDIARYIGYLATYGPDFMRSQEWAAEILGRAGIDGKKKMDLIDEHDLFSGRGGL